MGWFLVGSNQSISLVTVVRSIAVSLIFKKLGWKHGLLLLLFIAVMVAFSDQFTNFIKYSFERSRPFNTSGVAEKLRYFTYKPRGYSFYSGHASLSTTFTLFIFLLLRRHYKYLGFLFLFPLVFGYSRIYLGVHYPLDVCIGYLMGLFWGYIFYRLQKNLTSYQPVFITKIAMTIKVEFGDKLKSKSRN